MSKISYPNITVNIESDSPSGPTGSTHVVPNPNAPDPPIEQGSVFFISADFETFIPSLFNAGSLPFTLDENFALASPPEPERVKSIDLSSNNILAFTIDTANFLSLYDMGDVSDTKPVVSFSGITPDAGGESNFVKFNGSGNYLVLCIGGSDIVAVLDGNNSWARIGDLPGLSSATFSGYADWSPDDSYLAAATDDGVKIWETSGFTQVQSPTNDFDGSSIYFHPTLDICFVMSFSGYIFYDTSSLPWSEINATLDSLPEFASLANFRSDGEYVIVSGDDGNVIYRCSDPDPNNWVAISVNTSVAENETYGSAWSPNGERFVLADFGLPTVYVYDCVGIDEGIISYSFSINNGEESNLITDDVIYFI